MDEGDNDLAAFFAALLAALRQAAPGFGSDVAALLAALPDAADEARRLAGALVNGVMASDLRPFALVFDDLHLIEETAVLTALDYLIENLPPQMRLVATSRYDPDLSLARLRLQGRLAEFRLADLRFRDAEAAALLNDCLQLNLAALQSHSEGWAAGLRLLALSLDRRTSTSGRAAFISHLSQSSRHVFQFLADEALADQPFEMRQFLLETAVLEELTPELCTAVTQRREAAQLLDDLYRRNLFLTLVESDSGGLAYRTHDLFRDFLRQRLGKWIAQLPREMAGDRPGVAHIRGSLDHQAGRMDEARDYLETAVAGLQASGGEEALAEALFRLAGVKLEMEGTEASLELLRDVLTRPLPTAMKVAAHIDLAWSLVPRYDWAQVDEHVAQAIHLTLASGDKGAFQTLGQHMGIAIYFGDLGLAPFQQFCRQALARFGEGEGIIQMAAYLHLGI